MLGDKETLSISFSLPILFSQSQRLQQQQRTLGSPPAAAPLPYIERMYKAARSLATRTAVSLAQPQPRKRRGEENYTFMIRQKTKKSFRNKTQRENTERWENIDAVRVHSIAATKIVVASIDRSVSLFFTVEENLSRGIRRRRVRICFARSILAWAYVWEHAHLLHLRASKNDCSLFQSVERK